MLLGCLVGSERLFAGKTSGMRTYALVSLGAVVYVVVLGFVKKKLQKIPSLRFPDEHQATDGDDEI